jgi:hypothetical protein
LAQICLTFSSTSVTVSGPKITLLPDSNQLKGVRVMPYFSKRIEFYKVIYLNK